MNEKQIEAACVAWWNIEDGGGIPWEDLEDEARECRRTAMRAALAAAEREAWQPIETLELTNDGQSVLVTEDGTWAAMGVCRRGLLYESTSNGLQRFEYMEEVKFWMPLPKPPGDQP